jgi:hypothetical protein
MSFIKKISEFFSKNKKKNEKVIEKSQEELDILNNNKTIVDMLIEENKKIEKNIENFLSNIDENKVVYFIKDLIYNDIKKYGTLNKSVIKIDYSYLRNHYFFKKTFNYFPKDDLYIKYRNDNMNGFYIFMRNFIYELNNIILKNKEILLNVEILEANTRKTELMDRDVYKSIYINIVYDYTNYSNMLNYDI